MGHCLSCAFLILIWLIAVAGRCYSGLPLPSLHGLQEVDASSVTVRGGFWGERLKTHREVTIDHSLNMLERDGYFTNFDLAAGVSTGAFCGNATCDSDVYKVMEGAMYTLEYSRDDRLRKRVDTFVDRVLAAQQKDGFLITWFILKDQDKRWDNMAMHQLYCAGHFFEMAIAHEKLTGDQKVLNAARRFADNIDSVFGPGKRYDVDGHQEVELALVKLYRATGERRYMDLAGFFLDERGFLHGTERKPFDAANEVTGPKPMQRRIARQDHKPVIEQFEAVGHAVRACYMYSAMADIARFMDAPDYERALDRLWEDVVGRKMYLTGGLGTTQYKFEGFGDPYVLPLETAYCETCAGIANVLWQHRMNLLKGDARYADVMELALLNTVLSGMSLSGNAYFYQNRLLMKKGQRGEWMNLCCCPSNLARLIPQVGGLTYAHGKGRLIVNLYMAGEATIKLNSGLTVKMAQETDYPWDGHVRLTVTPEKASAFDLQLRIPCWAAGKPVPGDLYHFDSSNIPPVGLHVNGKPESAVPENDGYVHLNRAWKAGDVVELDLPMPVQRVYANAKVMMQAIKGKPLARGREKVALMRGPLVYCLEGQDHAGQDVTNLILTAETPLVTERRPDLLGGVTIIRGESSAGTNKMPLIAMPYYTWANRGHNVMTVWINRD
ncbi:MAG: beta-L-arabinofuranosidase domain-containing protein [bacterium]